MPSEWRSVRFSADSRVGTVDDVALDDGGDDLERADLVGRGRGDIATQDRNVAHRAGRQVTALGLVADGPRSIDGDGAQTLFAGQELVDAPRRRIRTRADVSVHPGRDLVDRPAHGVEKLVVL